MKKKNTIVAILLLSIVMITTQSGRAEACSVLPVSAIEQKNDLAAHALTQLNVSIENLDEISFDQYAGDYLWTPMCPKGLVSEATMTITFGSKQNPFGYSCTAVMKVKKTHIYKQGPARFNVDVLQDAICLE